MLKITPGELSDVLIVDPQVHHDARGFFLETYHEEKYRASGLSAVFVQDNHSRSTRGILRGLHAQCQHPQGKLIRVIEGEIFDVAVDIRRGSPTFARWMGVTLTGDNFRQCYVPPGFAHGFYVVSDVAQVEYKCTEYYDPMDEIVIRWNDPQVNVQWPVTAPVLSAKDQAGLPLAELVDRLPEYPRVER